MFFRCPHCHERIGVPNAAQQIMEQLVVVLRETGGNRTKAAERMGISLRSVRYHIARLRRMGIEVEPPPGPGPVPCADFVEKWGGRFPD